MLLAHPKYGIILKSSFGTPTCVTTKMGKQAKRAFYFGVKMKKTKVCNGPTCDNVEWPLSEFNKDRSRKDGLAPYCKRCQSHYHRERYKDPEGKQVKLSYNKAFYKTESGKASRKKAYNQGVRRYPNKRKARAAVNNAIAKGALKKAKSFKCNFEGCNEMAQEYHHDSYDPKDWLNVVPYCRFHHIEVDSNRHNV